MSDLLDNIDATITRLRAELADLEKLREGVVQLESVVAAHPALRAVLTLKPPADAREESGQRRRGKAGASLARIVRHFASVGGAWLSLEEICTACGLSTSTVRTLFARNPHRFEQRARERAGGRGAPLKEWRPAHAPHAEAPPDDSACSEG